MVTLNLQRTASTPMLPTATCEVPDAQVSDDSHAGGAYGPRFFAAFAAASTSPRMATCKRRS